MHVQTWLHTQAGGARGRGPTTHAATPAAPPRSRRRGRRGLRPRPHQPRRAHPQAVAQLGRHVLGGGVEDDGRVKFHVGHALVGVVPERAAQLFGKQQGLTLLVLAREGTGWGDGRVRGEGRGGGSVPAITPGACPPNLRPPPPPPPPFPPRTHRVVDDVRNLGDHRFARGAAVGPHWHGRQRISQQRRLGLGVLRALGQRRRRAGADDVAEFVGVDVVGQGKHFAG